MPCWSCIARGQPARDTPYMRMPSRIQPGQPPRKTPARSSRAALRAAGAAHRRRDWPVAEAGVHQFGRPGLRHRNPRVQAGLTAAERQMGVHQHSCQQLASGDLAVAHAGLPALRREAGGTPPHQPALSRRQRGAAVRFAQAPDGRVLAQCLGGGALCPAPAACGIGGLGVGAQGCAERVLLHADAVGVCGVCKGERPKAKG